MKVLDAAARRERTKPPAIEWFGEAERAVAAACLPGHALTIGFIPGAGEHFKRWPLERFIAIARAQFARERRVAFILGPDEVPWIEHIRSTLPDALLPGWQGPGSKPGGLTPREATALGARLTAVVSNDCGTAHILAASGVPMVALFGPTNPVKYSARTPILRVVRGYGQGAAAMEAISTADVLDALEELLSASVADARATA
jgi:ADP-heptose:LPS heptosyltransferase